MIRNIMRYFVLIFTFCASVFAMGETSYKLEVFATESALQGHSFFSGHANIQWQDHEETCIYLPFNDRNFFWDPAQNVGNHANKNRNFRPAFGEIEIINSSVPYEVVTPFLIKIGAGHSSVAIDFRFMLPQWVESGKQQHLFHRFYPQKLSRCPRPDEDSFQYTMSQSHFRAKVHYPKAWYLATPAFHNGSDLEIKGRFLVFNLSLNYRVETMKIGRLPVTVVYKSKSFARYKYHLKRFITQIETLLGPFPFERLILLESEELERQAIPGVISINKPKQLGMDSFQGRYLNWTLWQLAFFSCQQWFGASMWAKNHDHQWFFRGIAEFYANLVLSENPRIHNIIASTEGEEPWLKFNYSQSADLLASILNILSPNNKLVDNSLKISRPFSEQNNLDYIRHYMLLRFLSWYLGPKFLTHMKMYYQTFKGQPVDHLSFLHFMMGSFAGQKEKITKYIQQWWSQSTWPDFDLSSYEVNKISKDKYQVKLIVIQPENFLLPFDISFSDGERSELIRFEEEKSEIELTLDFKPKHIEVNPGREIHDRNRFNNSNRWPSIAFFPGNAKTLGDDSYTALWFPFISKLPGEGVSVMLAMQFFKYVNSGLSLAFSYVPEEDRMGFKTNYVTQLKSLGGVIYLSAAQNYGPGLRDQRVMDISFNRPLIDSTSPSFVVGARLRHRGIVSVGDGHNTWALTSNIQSTGFRACGYKLYAIHEKTLPTREFSYTRSFSLASLGCQSPWGLLGLRSFWGALKRQGDTPPFVDFAPQTLDEARIRIDEPRLEPSRRLWTASLDLEIPMPIPVSSSFFLMPRKSTWRLYYDYGEAKDPGNQFQAYGTGIRIPLGGDVVGKRSLALANFSFLAVLGRKYDGKFHGKPGFLIDFLGKL